MPAPRLKPVLFALLCFGVAPALRAQSLETLKANTDRWIEMRSRFSRESAEWQTDRQILANGIETLRAAKVALEESLRVRQSETDRLGEESATAAAHLAELAATEEWLRENLSRYETRLRTLATRLPPPLQEDLGEYLRRIPAGEGATSANVPARVQNLVAVLTLIDEFNNGLHLTHQLRTHADGSVTDVRVLYWGLARGYAIDATGTRAWMLRPVGDEWTWHEIPGQARSIQELFEVYEKFRDPVLLTVPYALPAKEAQS